MKGQISELTFSGPSCFKEGDLLVDGNVSGKYRSRWWQFWKRRPPVYRVLKP